MVSKISDKVRELSFSPTSLRGKPRTYSVTDGLLLITDERGLTWQTPYERVGLREIALGALICFWDLMEVIQELRMLPPASGVLEVERPASRQQCLAA